MIGQPFYVLDKIDSTNNYAMEQVNQGIVTPGTAWFTPEQTAGKGQRGKQWLSVPGENIALTVALQPGPLPLSGQFMLSVAISLGAYDFYTRYAGDETRIKWSNDIYWRDRKAGGILIENVLRGSIWQYAIVGIGLNINQTGFSDHLPNPVSLRQITGSTWDTETLARELCTCFDKRVQQLMSANMADMQALASGKTPLPVHFQDMLEEYKNKLFRWQENGLYKNRETSEYFQATIRDVLPNGRLCLEKAPGDIMETDFGEVEFIIAR